MGITLYLRTRPDWDEFIKDKANTYIACPCGQSLQTNEQIRDHWQQGHFDYMMPALSNDKPLGGG